MVNPPGCKVDVQACRRATALLNHRGPDADGEWVSDSGEVFLGHRRLSIIDLSDRSRQPMVGPSGAALVFNGEIYNFKSIRNELEGLGCKFKSSGDTEVLLQAMETWGPGCLSRLEGMFAFLLWDPARERALAVRDFFGIKPLYVFQTRNGGLAVSSEIKSLYALSELRPEIDEQALPEFLRFRTLCGGRTLLRGVKQLKPGHLLRFDRRKATTREECYWDPVSVAAEAASFRSPDGPDFLGEFRETVDRHLIADVPVGVQFSGGVDSSLISAVTARDLGVTLKGFHCRVKDPGLDESPHALNVARELDMDVRVALLDDRSFFSDLLEKLTWFHDEPLTHPNSLGIYLISRLARPNVTVLLSGEAADEFFGGYGRYPLLLVHRLAKLPVSLLARSDWLCRALARSQGQLGSVIQYVQRNEHLSVDEQITSGPQFADASILSDILRDSTAVSRSVEQRSLLIPRLKEMDVVTRCQLFDVKAYLPPLLMRQDKMSMAASIENRVPFATPAVFTKAMSLPSRSRASLFRRKRFLKALLSRYIPNDMARRPKQGFGIPLPSWLQREAGQERLQGLIAPDSPLHQVIDTDKVRSMVANFRGERSQADVLWTLLSLKLWMEIFCHPGKEPVLNHGAAQP